MKNLFSVIFLFHSLFASVDANGWALVEKPKQQTSGEVLQEEDPSIWVVFAKRLGAEKFLIRFPEDPAYRYLASNEIELSAAQGETSYRLRVLQPDPTFLQGRTHELSSHPDILLVQVKEPAPNVLDLLYQSKGKWVWERLLLTSHHLYFLQTTSDTPLSERHQKFASSLDIEQ